MDATTKSTVQICTVKRVSPENHDTNHMPCSNEMRRSVTHWFPCYRWVCPFNTETRSRIYIYISTSGAFCMYEMFQWHLLNVYQVDRAQGSFCVCAQPMRDDDTTSPFLTDWVHTQMIPGHHVERRSTLECIHYLSQQTWYFHILFTHSLQGCSYWH